MLKEMEKVTNCEDEWEAAKLVGPEAMREVEETGSFKRQENAGAGGSEPGSGKQQRKQGVSPMGAVIQRFHEQKAAGVEVSGADLMAECEKALGDCRNDDEAAHAIRDMDAFLAEHEGASKRGGA